MGGNTLQFREAISLRLKVFSDSRLNYLFRPHSVGACYQTGYMANGKLTFVKSAACSNGPPKGGVWFPVSVTVHGQDAQVYHSGVLVASIKSHFAPRAWGGVFTFHGYKNVVLFRKFKIAPQTYITKRCKKVVRNSYDTKVALDAGQWHNKKLLLATTLFYKIPCYNANSLQWNPTDFSSPRFFEVPNEPKKLDLQITSIHQSKPVIMITPPPPHPVPPRFFEPP